MSGVARMLEVMQARRCTQLGVGPMSEATVNATIDVATHLRIPVMLVASRRQIEAGALGGGYVNGWDTASFSAYIRKRDPSGFVILCRDHGGPWQGSYDTSRRLSLKEAMEAAKHSFEEDIAAGFEILHIDPSVGLKEPPAQAQIVERLEELFEFCHAKALQYKKQIAFEFGKEEQGVDIEGAESFSGFLEHVMAFCAKKNLPKPLFVVGQTGTKVMERRNIGNFEKHFRTPGEVPPEIQVPKLVDLCRKHGVFLKAHNADYLSDEGIRFHTQLGIHAANVAPEFGVGESLQLLALCEELACKEEREQFLSLAYESRKWEKWMIPGTLADDREKAVIAGHYVFSSPQFKELKERLRRKCALHNIRLDDCLKERVKQLIYRYLFNFNLVRHS